MFVYHKFVGNDDNVQKSEIDSSSEEGLKPTSIVGNIEIENVSFKYPSRPEVPVCIPANEEWLPYF